jgi:CHAT domain-containing protein
MTINDNLTYLGDKFRIRILPSCQILKYCSDRKPIETNNYGLVENATGDLPFTPFECEQIAQILAIVDANHLKGKAKATINNYLKLLKQVNGLHSSHHAQSNLSNNLESALILADGKLTLANLMLKRYPDLAQVFLSCCETNLGYGGISDDLLTLGTGFLCAGARTVIASLWAVDDLATALFSTFYYQSQKQGKTRSESLQIAQHKLRNLTGNELQKYAPQLQELMTQAISQKQEELDKLSLNDQESQKVKTRLENLKSSQLSLKIKLSLPDTKCFNEAYYWGGFICQGLS